jgi:major membrane immunogen (membrane-anchored lipoprotein)
MYTGVTIIKKQFIFLLLLFVLLLSACSNIDELSGKTFDVNVRSNPSNPAISHSIMTLEFLDGKITTTSLDGEEGTYELKDDKLAIQFENENESLEIEFTFEKSDEDSSTYSAVLSDSDFQIEDSDQVSRYKGFFLDLPRSSYVEFTEK